MSVLVYTESWNGNFRKSSFETVSYASETAKALGTDVIAVSLERVSDDEVYKLANFLGKLLSAKFNKIIKNTYKKISFLANASISATG